MLREALISFPMFGEGFVLDPPAYISIRGFNIYMYGIVIACGFLLAVLYTGKFCHRIDMKMDDVYDLIIFAVPTAVVFARLYYVIFYFSWESIKADPMSVLRIRDGGLAIYGGVIGAVLALFLRCRAKKIPFGGGLDVASFGLLIGQSVGRWGNFFNREAFGYETDIFCRMGLTLSGSTIYVHPTFLYESLWNFIGLIVLHFVCKYRRKYRGQFFILYVAWYGLGRAFIEGLRTDSLWLIPDVIRVSQLLAAVTFVLAAAVYVINALRIKNGRSPLLGGAIDGHDIIAPEEDPSEENTSEE